MALRAAGLALCVVGVHCRAKNRAAEYHQDQLPFLNARIAVLLTGQPFRTAKMFAEDHARYCVNASFEAQHVASQSLLSNVIEPLERHGAAVEVLFTFPLCNDLELGAFLLQSLKRWFVNRVVAYDVISSSRNVGHSWQLAYLVLMRHVRRGASYDFVFSVRHDLELLQNILLWPANFFQLLFLAEGDEGIKVDCARHIRDRKNCRTRDRTICRVRDRTICRVKINDKLLWVPHKLLPSVFDVLGQNYHVDPHSLIERFIRVPHVVLQERYDGRALINSTCGGQMNLVPQQLRLDMREVGLLNSCGKPFYRFAPDRGWSR